MKKKISLVCLLVVTILFVNNIDVMAYSPDYLPGGVNYLSEDNFYYETQQYYTTLDNFLIKPFTTYTLTVPYDYYCDPFVVEIILYNNSTELEILELIPDMFSTSDGDWFSSTFTTTSETNYLSMVFQDVHLYFEEGSPHEIQLEEGPVFTGFEYYIEGDLIDTSAPYFQNAGSVVSYFDSPITISEIQSALSAYDSIDGDVTSSIVLLTDNYTNNMDVLGIYTCVFEVSDSSANVSQVTIEIEVVDVLKPVFSQLETIQAVYPNSYTPSEILNQLSASDNYDGDISNQIVLVDDNYSTNSNIVGIYDMEFEVTDSSGNTQNYIQTVEVIDDEFPVISGITSISIGYDEIITETQIINNLDYTDNYDDKSNLEIVLDSDTYTGHNTEIGSYEMIFSVTDSSGNKTSQSISINVVDEIGPFVYFNSSIIQTYTDTVMELPDFTQLLISTNEIDGDMDYYVTVKYDSYTRNSSVPGTYHIKLNLKNDLGEEYNKELEIRVIDRPIDYIHIDQAETRVEGTTFDKYKDYILGGILSVLLVVSNIVWIVVFKRKS